MPGRNLLADDAVTSKGRNLLADDLPEQQGLTAPAKNTSAPPVSLMDKIGNAAGEFNDIFRAPLGSLATGLLSAVPNAAINIANIPNQLISDKFPKFSLPDVINPESYYNANPEENKSDAFKMLGEALGGVATGAGAYNKAAQALNITRQTPLLGRALTAGLSQGAISDSDAVGGRLAPALLAGTVPALNAVRPSVLGETIAEKSALNSNKYKSLYNNLLNKADETVGKFSVTPELSALKNKAKYLLDNASDAKIDALTDFISNPSIKNAHFAQSELGALSRALDKKLVPTNIDNKLKPIVGNLRKALQDSIEHNLTKANSPELSDAYKALGQGYRADVVPFNTKEMRAYNRGDISNATLAKKMANNEAFTLKKASKNIPGLSAYQTLNDPILKYALTTFGLGGIGGLGYHYLGGH